VRSLPFKTIRSGILEDLGFVATGDQSANDIAQVTGLINAALDMAYPWLDSGWPELRKVTSETITSQVIDLDTVGDGKFGTIKILGISKEHPYKSSHPQHYSFNITSEGIVLDESVSESSLYVEHIEAPPIFSSTAWATATSYVVGDVRLQTNDCYYCLTAHTSGTFATDLAAAKWLVLPFPAFLHIPVRSAVVAAMEDSDGYTSRASALRSLMGKNLDDVALRYDTSRHGLGAGSQR